MKHRPRGLLIGAAVVAMGVTFLAQASEKFKARLSPVPVEASTLAGISGSGSATAELAATRLTIGGTFQGLRTPATTAQLHDGLKRGVRGPVISDLTVTKGVSGTISGSVTLNRGQLQDLKDGKLYIQIQSEKAPDGNLWGWLLQ